ncbi:Cyclic nucleotide-gated cation channel beta-1, partial [Ophiophagus hannah]
MKEGWEGRKEGRKEGKKEGREEGREERMKKRMKEGWQGVGLEDLQGPFPLCYSDKGMMDRKGRERQIKREGGKRGRNEGGTNEWKGKEETDEEGEREGRKMEKERIREGERNDG